MNDGHKFSKQSFQFEQRYEKDFPSFYFDIFDHFRQKITVQKKKYQLRKFLNYVSIFKYALNPHDSMPTPKKISIVFQTSRFLAIFAKQWQTKEKIHQENS